MQSKHMMTVSIVVGICLTWVAMSELIQGLQDGWQKPFFITYFIHGGYTLNYIPYVLLRRLRTGEWLYKETTANVFPVSLRQIACAAFGLQLLGAFIAGSWYISLKATLVSANNAIYQSASAFVFLFAMLWHTESFSARKLLAVCISVGGVVLICLLTSSSDDSSVTQTPSGYLWVLLSTITYALYEVLYARWTQHRVSRLAEAFCGSLEPPASEGLPLVGGSVPGKGEGGRDAVAALAARVKAPMLSGGADEAEEGAPSSPLVSRRRLLSGMALASSSSSGEPGGGGFPVTYYADDDAAVGAAVAAKAEAHPVPASRAQQAELSALVLGLMGTFTLLTLWPLFFILDATGIEPFEWPSASKARLLAFNTALDSIYNFLLLLGVTVTSPLVMSLGTILVVPVSLVADWALHGATLSWGAGGGVLLIAAGLVVMQLPVILQWGRQCARPRNGGSARVLHVVGEAYANPG